MIDKKTEEKLDNFILDNKENIKKDIFSLVSIKSVSVEGEGGFPFGRGCAEALAWALERAENFAFKVKNCDNYCGMAEYGENEGGKLGVFCHLDVVPEGVGWINSPYSAVEKEGFLIGRGVADNKGSAVCNLYALRFLKENSIKLKHNVLLYFGCNEEAGMKDIDYFLSHEEAPVFSIVPDSNFPVCYGEKGVMRFSFIFDLPAESILEMASAGTVVNAIPSHAEAVIGGRRITASGISAHAAFPEGSVNAINALSKRILKDALDDGTRRIFDSVGKLTYCYDGSVFGLQIADEESGAMTVSGTILKKEEDHLILSFDMRYPVTADGGFIKKQLEKTADSMGAVFTLESDSKPSFTPLSSPVIKKLCEIAEYVHGKKLEPFTMGGGTYARKLPFAVGFGPGLPDASNLYSGGRGNAHQCDECISFDLLLKGLKADVIALIELDDLI